MQLVNKGQYGEVYRTNTVAIKEMDIRRASNWLIELILTRTLTCDKLMTARDVIVTYEKVSIYMDFVDYDLWSWRNKRRDVTNEISERIIGDITIGLAYLHYCNILHGDLKPSNVLVCTSGGELTCKITDFGYSSVFTKPKSIRYGTSMYSPPECIVGTETKFSADIWALGLVVSFVVTGRLPWLIDRQHLSKSDKSWFISAAYHWCLYTNQEWPYMTPSDEHVIEIDNTAIFTGRLYDIVLSCLSVNRNIRSSAMDIVEILTRDDNMGINLSTKEEQCRCCYCNFSSEHAEKMKSILEGKYVDISDNVHEFVDIAVNIDFMPTLECKL